MPERIPAFVASTGGHLVQMQLLAPLLEPQRHASALWITHRSPQSESMLAGRRVEYLPAIPARDWRRVASSTVPALAMLRRYRVDRVYSTGAALALVALPWSFLSGARPSYYESLARSDGPSVTGRALARVPWVPVHTQYPGNATRRWVYDHSLLEAFRVAEPDPAEPVLRRVLVSVGTVRSWPFTRLIRRLIEILPPEVEVVWQTGVTDVSDLGITAVPLMSDEDFRAEVERADVVIAHAGVGSFIRCLEAGKVPILVPRRAAHGEHVDDHQLQIAQVGADRGLAITREADELTLDDLRDAMRRRVAPAAL